MSSIVGKNFANFKLQRKKRVKLLGTVMSGVKIRDVACPVDSEMLFKRISFTKRSQEQFKDNFEYELAPYPLSLYDAVGMRKTMKSFLYDAFVPICDSETIENTVYVVDGGFLIHRVVWQQREILATILDRYAEYVMKCYKKMPQLSLMDIRKM